MGREWQWPFSAVTLHWSLQHSTGFLHGFISVRGLGCADFGLDRGWEMEGLGRVLLLYNILCGMMSVYKSSSSILLLHDRRNHPSMEESFFQVGFRVWLSNLSEAGEGKEEPAEKQVSYRERESCWSEKEETRQRTGTNMHSLEENEIFQ